MLLLLVGWRWWLATAAGWWLLLRLVVAFIRTAPAAVTSTFDPPGNTLSSDPLLFLLPLLLLSLHDMMVCSKLCSESSGSSIGNFP
jgi:hypothetical protein